MQGHFYNGERKCHTHQCTRPSKGKRKNRSSNRNLGESRHVDSTYLGAPTSYQSTHQPFKTLKIGVEEICTCFKTVSYLLIATPSPTAVLTLDREKKKRNIRMRLELSLRGVGGF